MSEKKVQTYTFSNGFRLIYQHSVKSNISSVYTYCNVGSALETDSVRGACHMIEHMCFQGTYHKTNSKDVFLEYDKIGAYLNAFTKKEYTVFEVNCDILYLEKCIDVLSDIMIYSKFDKTKFYKEQKVVVEENLIHENDANHHLTEKMNEMLYKGNSYSYSVDTLLYHPTKNTLTYELLEEWYHCFYVPSNMILSIVSPYSFSKIISILEKTGFTKKNNKNNKPFIKSLQNIPETALPFPILINTFLLEPTYSIIVKKGVKTNHIQIGFRTCPYSSSDKYVFELVGQILCGTIGRLFTLLRDKHNLTYGVRSEVDYIPHMGYFIIHVETEYKHLIHNGHFPSKKSPGVIPFIIKTIQSIVQHGFQQEEINHSKGYLYGKMRMKEEDIDVLADYNGREWILSNSSEPVFCEKIFTPYHKLYDTFIKPITKTYMHDVIKKYFRLDNMVVGIIGEKVPLLVSVKECCEKGWTKN